MTTLTSALLLLTVFACAYTSENEVWEECKPFFEEVHKKVEEKAAKGEMPECFKEMEKYCESKDFVDLDLEEAKEKMMEMLTKFKNLSKEEQRKLMDCSEEVEKIVMGEISDEPETCKEMRLKFKKLLTKKEENEE